jgi:hypothetical protein
MTFENFLRCLLAYRRPKPFVPYLLQFVTGETIRVGHPEAIRMSGEVAQFREPSGRFRLFDCHSVCQFLDILPAAPANPAPAAPDNEE